MANTITVTYEVVDGALTSRILGNSTPVISFTIGGNTIDISSQTEGYDYTFPAAGTYTIDFTLQDNLTDLSYLFSECANIKTIWFDCDTSNVVNMRSLLFGCSGLEDVNADMLDVSNVTNMITMFGGCENLITVDVRNWDTSKVTNMSYMFYECFRLATLYVSDWDTSNVTNMAHMFGYCESLQALDVSNWDTSNVTDINYMFYRCIPLQALDVSNWDTDNVTNMAGTFDGCGSLTSLNVSNWNTANVTDMHLMFSDCKSLTTLDISKWDTANVTDMHHMFGHCESLTSLNVSNWNTANVTNISGMFGICGALTTLDVSNWNTSKVTNMTATFIGCRLLTVLNISNWNTSNVTDISGMFQSCDSLTSLDVGKWDTSKVTDMSEMFLNCDSLTTLDLSNWETSNVTNTTSMFAWCSVKKIIFGEFTNLGNNMFQNCKNLDEIHCKATQSPVADSTEPFTGNIKTGGTLYCPFDSVGYETNWKTLIEDYGWRIYSDFDFNGNAIAICEDIIFEDDADKVEYRIYADDNLIYSGYAYRYPNEEGMLEIELNDILSDYLKNQISFTEGLQEMEGYLRKFRIQSSNASKEVDVYNGWEKAKSAILNDPISNEIDPRQHLFINYIDGYNDLSVYRDGESLGALGKICGGVYIVPRTDATCGGKVSYAIKKGENKVVASQNYTYKGTNKNYALYYVNAYGGWDSLAIRGNVTQTDNMQSQTYKNKTNGKVKYLNTITPTWRLYTDDMNDGSKMHHLLESTEVYLHNLETNEIVPVVITDSNCVYKTYANQGNTRFHYIINVEASNYKIRK